MLARGRKTVDSLKTLLLCIAAPLALNAQSYTASLQGVVRDPQSAAIPGARITATDIDRNTRYTAIADEAGRYVLAALPPGSYRLSVEAHGFKTYSQGPIDLQVSQQAKLDVPLAVGELTEVVEVRAETPLLEATTATVGRMVENRRIMDLPLNTRNVYSLIFLTPGVSGSVGNNYNNVSFAINGSGNRDIMIDGVTATQPTVNGVVGISIFPSVDAIDEYRVLASNFSAEFGRAQAGVLNVVYKSGTNSLHCSAYEFLRNSVLDANNFFPTGWGTNWPASSAASLGA